jgi:hypothetical protein
MTARGTRTARAVNLYVNFGWWISAIGLVVVPIGLVVVLGALRQPDRPAPDMPVLARIQVDEASLAPPPAGVVLEPSTLVHGQGELRIRTRSKSAWTLLFLMIEITLAVLLFVYGQLRALMRSVLERQPFLPENSLRVRRVGFIVIAWSLIVPVLQLLVGVAMVDEVVVRGLILEPPWNFRLETLFLGLAILVLAEVFMQASELQADQSLTV